MVYLTHPELGVTRLYLHRLIWLLKFRESPPAMIDHINRIPFDNRPSNLRAATSKENNNNSIRSKSCFGEGEVFQLRNGKFRMIFRYPGTDKWSMDFDDRVQAIAGLNYLSYLYEAGPRECGI